VAIVGYVPLAKAHDQVGALLVAVADGKRLRYAGKVGTGFSAAVRRDLLAELEPDRVEAARFDDAPRLDAVWVEPRLVAQVRFTEWTGDDKLRHPSFQGLRPDRAPLDCVRERPDREPRAPDIVLTNPDRLVYPDDGVTKRMVADYFAAVAEPMLRALADRPLALERWPKGVGQPSWYQQNIGAEAAPWMTLVETPTRTRTVRHLVADRDETLLWMAQMSVLTIHMWSSRRGHLDSPDWVIFDFDPADGRGIEQAIGPAQALRRLTERLGVLTVVKTSGKRGLHVLVPLAPGYHHEEAAEWADRVADRLVAELPEVTTERAKAARHGRLYLDCLQNGYGKTIVAPYSPRGVPGAPVSTPLSWDEVTNHLDPARFTIRTVPKRIASHGDLFAPALGKGQRLPELD
jgi:bifunctional non-homologous end joining protein LigD